MKCKNCGEMSKDHYYKEKYCDNIKNYKLDSKQFIPQEEFSEKEAKFKFLKWEQENKGCGKLHHLGTEECGKRDYLCPSCSLKDDTGSASNHSSSMVQKDKDPFSSQSGLGSDIPSSLSDKMINRGQSADDVEDQYFLHSKDVVEAVRKLKEEMPNQDINEWKAQQELIDKIFGEFK